MKRLFPIVALGALLLSGKSPEADAYVLLTQSIHAMNSMETMTYRMTKYERIDGEMNKGISELKIDFDPFRVYMRQFHPKDGVEVLYEADKNNGKALVNPNGFPWMNLNLDPMGGIMRDNNHHHLLCVGHLYFNSILTHLAKKYEKEAPNMMRMDSIVTWDERPCYKVDIDIHDFDFIDYTMQEDEDVMNVAQKHKVAEQMILDNNKNLDDFEDGEAEMVIKIPNAYAKSITLYIDQESLIPVVIKIFDQHGLYEHYQFTHVAINIPLKDEEFSKDYEGYGF